MKRFLRLICLFLVCATICSIPAYAVENTVRGSDYFMSRSCYLWKTSGTQFQVWFDVTAMSGMDELGVSTIIVQRSADGEDWENMKTYRKANYSNMICEDTGRHASYVTYSGAETGYYYRAYVCFYAKNSVGTAEYISHTSSITMP